MFTKALGGDMSLHIIQVIINNEIILRQILNNENLEKTDTKKFSALAVVIGMWM